MFHVEHCLEITTYNNIDVDPKCHFSSKLSTARLSAVLGFLQRQTRCLHYGRYDIYAFFSIWVNCYIIT